MKESTKILIIIKWFRESMDESEYHQRRQFFLDESKTGPFWYVHK